MSEPEHFANPSVQKNFQYNPLDQAHELNEALVGKRKWATEFPEFHNLAVSEDTSLESTRSLKRRNGVEVGGLSVETGSAGDVVGIQTRKRKSLDRLVTTPLEQDIVSFIAPDRSSKKLKAGAGGEEGNGVDSVEVYDEGTVAQGSALRLRFTRSGNAFSVSKRATSDDMAVEEARSKGEGDVIGILDGSYNSKGGSETGPSKRNGMEGEPSTADDPASERKEHHQPSGAGLEDTCNSPPVKASESRQPLTREIYRVPSHTGWFSWSKIHSIERRSLSEFFDGKSMSKTPKIYKDYRDFIINRYRENTQRTLTFTEVRRMLIGDVNALRRVFDFLDHWGLINHQVSQESNEQAPHIGLVETVADSIPSGVRMALGPTVTTSGMAARSNNADSSMSLSGGGPVLHPETLSSYKSIFTNFPTDGVHSCTEASRESAVGYTCDSCGGDCMKVLFRCRDELQAGFNLCADCFRDGKYGPGMAARDFTRIEADKEVADQWTTKETLSLLEAITRFGDNWSHVADHVGTKSKSDCVKQFIQLPFGDRFLSNEGANEPVLQDKGNGTNTMECGRLLVGDHVGDKSGCPVYNEQFMKDGDDTDGPAKSARPHVHEEPSPFADASNPVLAQVAFMSAMVGPRVAAAAAQAAIMAIAEEEPALINSPIFSSQALNSMVPKEGITTGRQTPDSSKESCRLDTKYQEALSLQGPKQSAVEKGVESIPTVAQMQAGLAVALAAAATNAKLLADQEDREMEHLMSDIIENQLKRLYAKLEHFEELEMLLEKERVQLEQARQLLYAHHIQFAESRFYLNRERHG